MKLKIINIVLCLINKVVSKLEKVREKIFIKRLKELCEEYFDKNRDCLEMIKVYKTKDYEDGSYFTFDVLIFIKDYKIEKDFDVELENIISEKLKDFDYSVNVYDDANVVFDFISFATDKNELIFEIV